MRVLVDFDQTVFDTSKLIEKTEKLVKDKYKIDPKEWAGVWYKESKKRDRMSGQKYAYHIWLHVNLFRKKRKDFKSEEFLEDYAKVIGLASKFLYPDSKNFLREVKKVAELVLLTIGDDKFQSWKIDNSGLKNKYDEVQIVPSLKHEHLNRLFKKEETHILVDDYYLEIDEAKKRYPQLITIHLPRFHPRNWHKNKPAKLTDFKVGSLSEALKIIKDSSRRFIREKDAIVDLKKGKSLVYPTDTAYGLGVDALNLKAVGQLYKIKGRKKQPVHIVVSSLAMAKKYVEFSETAEKVFKKFMPGPLTLVLPVRKDVPTSIKKLTGGTGTLGIRVPDNNTALSLVKKLKRPITTPSANVRGGETSYTAAEAFKQFYGKKYQPDFYLDKGLLPKVKPSTLLAINDKKIKVLRAGPITKKEILKKI